MSFKSNPHTIYLTFKKLIWVIFAFISLSGTVNAQESPEKSELNVKTVLAIGDSLTAGYGLGPGEGFTDQLQVWLTEQLGEPVTVVNAGVSGDTSTGGRSRLEWNLAPVKGGKPDLVIVELGANDGLRGVDPNITAENIDAIVGTLTDRGIKVLIAGMIAPPNLGPDYAEIFNGTYPRTAQKYGVPLYPFFLDGVALDPELNLPDGMHPTKEGIAIIVSKIGPMVLDSLK